METPDLDSWKLMNVVNVIGDRDPSRETIVYCGEPRPCPEGFCYSFRYRLKKGGAIWGAGIVNNPEYAEMSPAELELTLTARDPVTEEDRKEAMDRLGIAEKMKGAEE